jgi:hypothetical protein
MPVKRNAYDNRERRGVTRRGAFKVATVAVATASVVSSTRGAFAQQEDALATFLYAFGTDSEFRRRITQITADEEADKDAIESALTDYGLPATEEVVDHIFDIVRSGQMTGPNFAELEVLLNGSEASGALN